VKTNFYKYTSDFHSSGNINNSYFSDKDSCETGISREYYKNGNLKAKGEIAICSFVDKEYEVTYDSIYYDSVIFKTNFCGQIGLWFDYDSLGNEISKSRYSNNNLIYQKRIYTDTAIYIDREKCFFRLSNNSLINSYTFCCSSKNDFLEIMFNSHRHSNYWQIYDHPIDFTKDSLCMSNSFENWEKPLIRLNSNDTGNNENHFDFNKLPRGKYYVYYYGLGNLRYEVVIETRDWDKK
jgi:antitoxin component YwqK of YwqJK toxin-antitoxin module